MPNDKEYLHVFLDNAIESSGMQISGDKELHGILEGWDFTEQTSYKQKMLAVSKMAQAFVIGYIHGKNS